MKPNVVFILADQLRSSSLPLYGESQISTPQMDRLAAEGTTFTNVFSTCSLCTPYRSMLLTGRHPQTTGHLMNFVRTRHDEIGLGDVFSRTGYRTGWVGKWHLHTGSFPEIGGRDFVPEGRDRLGFEFWRAYNFHMQYFDGWIHKDNWLCEQWEGYETHALYRYAVEFLEQCGGEPFCLFISPHQPHNTPFTHAPEEFYSSIPQHPELPENVPESAREEASQAYRHYLAMVLALDEMVGRLLDYLDRKGLADSTLVVFTSDHGSEMGAHGASPWKKTLPHLESMRVPLIMRLPGVFDAHQKCDSLVSPVDLLPTLCGVCDVPVPRTVEGHNLRDAFLGRANAFQQEAIFTMNFSSSYNHLHTGQEWRGVVTRKMCYARWLNGKTELYDFLKDPLQRQNLADDPGSAHTRKHLEDLLQGFMRARGDRLVPCTEHSNWYDGYRRIVRNAYGPLGDPECPPDWSLLQ